MIDPRLYTIAVHAGTEPDPRTGAVMTPIYQTSTFVQEAPGQHKGWDYSRGTNPSRDGLEAALAAIEGASHASAFSSGLAAEQAIVQNLSPGDHVLVCNDVYGGTGRLFRTLLGRFGIEFEFADLSRLDRVRDMMRDQTRMIWVETPTNPTLQVLDIAGIAEIARARGATVVVDNTFATPVFQSPLDLGADLVVHSTTKYIGGHSDLIGGAVMTNDDGWAEKVRYVQFAAGAVSGPIECFLLHRSIKSLPVRMAQHAVNAQAVAEFLAGHPKIRRTYYPGLPDHPGHELARRQMSGYSGIVSLDIDGDLGAATRFVQNLEVFALAESLGGVESLVNHPQTMTHASVPEPLRRELGIGPSLLRLSVGIEHVGDLVDDLAQALETI
ncbi:MAG: aminotransferase class I/II-fold pyridoxal phosphate-dependent enzyme [Proteobacteria bacterium]|nr:MAG: aminotransferase class I/II-fold pyridoxal phosphate-dependent enzyme [Pseudomonadota bacterium]